MSCDGNTKISAKKLYSILTKKKNEIAAQSPIYLFQKDFTEGTYIIDKPGYYILKENIIFSPNPDNDYLPKYNNPKYQTLGFSLGFFACIIIAAKDVYLDLNNKTISGSDQFVLQQRFFSIIELADAPFIPSQGPGNFGSTIKSAENTIIANGTLGKSSHHGIHANLANNILLENLKIHSFEVAGIALNGGHCMVLNNVEIANSKTDVPILGTYSAARFAKLFVKHILSKNILAEDAKAELNRRLNILQQEIDQTFSEAMSNERISSDLFRNETKLPDGNVYGVLIKNEGFAVNDYVNASEIKTKGKKRTLNIFLHKVKVKNLNCKVIEIPALSAKGGKGATTDVAGAVLQIDRITQNGKYVGTALSNLQLYLAQLSINYKIPLGKNNISQEIISWANSGDDISVLLKKGYKYKLGGDVMAHFCKAIQAFRFDALENVYMKKCSFENVTNHGYLGNDKLLGNYSRSHDEAKRNGYFGADSTGINVSYCSDVKISKCDFSGVHSKHGNAIGLNVIFESDVTLNKCKFEDIKAGTLEGKNWKGIDYSGETVKYSDGSPNKIPRSIGIFIEKKSVVEMDSTDIRDLRSPSSDIKIFKE